MWPHLWRRTPSWTHGRTRWVRRSERVFRYRWRAVCVLSLCRLYLQCIDI
jgi:hypothetical protein